MLLILTACKSQSDEAQAPTYYQDIQPILESRCTGCHLEGGIAPFALDSYEKVSTYADAVAASVTQKTMPPWLAGPADVEYLADPQLDANQIETIVTWAIGDKAEGESEVPGAPLPSLHDGLERVDTTLQMPAPYSPPQGDDYRCFLLPWDQTETTYVRGINAVPGNEAVVHHIAVFIIPPDFVAATESWKSDDGQPGYTCFGGPSGNPDIIIPTLQLGGWLPGNPGTKFPRGIGIEVEPGSLLALQMHYSSPLEIPDPDQTTLEFEIATNVEKRGVYAPWLNVEWVGGNMLIPSGEEWVQHSIRDDPRLFFGAFIGGLNLDNGFDIHGALFHMHQLGQSGHTKLYKEDGTETTILDIPKWDFNWQQEYFLKSPVSFRSGDELEVSCTWSNTAESQPIVGAERRPPQDVNWGEQTQDEMCVVNLLITEAGD
jgi:hypothetical protein